MNRYHKKVYISEQHKKQLELLTYHLNTLKWRYTSHCLDTLKYRTIKLEDILLFIKDLKLNDKDIFEYYTDYQNNIIKLCYRIQYTKGMDLILIIGQFKNIITIYLNTAEDNHITLNKNLYVKK